MTVPPTSTGPYSRVGASARRRVGGIAEKYEFVLAANVVYTITPKPVTYASTAADKVYDGTVAAPPDLAGSFGAGDILSGDEVTAGGGTYAAADAGADVAVTGSEAGGADAGNYEVTFTITGTIAPRPITAISEVTVVTRAVDGTTDATFDTSAAVGTGVVDAELADFRAGGLQVSGSFPSAEAGDYTLTVTYSLDTNGSFKAANYRLDSDAASAALPGRLGDGPQLGCKPKPGVPAARVEPATTASAGRYARNLSLSLPENRDGRTRPVAVGCIALTSAAGHPYDRYQITSGGEQERFTVDREGTLRYVGPGENHERTAERVVTVAATAGAGEAAALRVRVEITDADDASVVRLSERQARVGDALTATLADEDAGVRDERWQWQRKATGDAWVAVAGATASRYTPVAADVGRVLRAQVTYADTHGEQRAASVPTAAVALDTQARMLQAAMAGLGRTAAAAAVDVIGQRFAPTTLQAGAPDRLGVDLTLNRRALHVPEAGDAAARGRLARSLTEALGVRVTPDGVSYVPASGAALLADSAFSAQQGHGAGRWGIWGSGDYRRFAGAVDDFEQTGSVLGGWLGADYRVAANALAGLAASYGPCTSTRPARSRPRATPRSPAGWRTPTRTGCGCPSRGWDCGASPASAPATPP